MELRTLFLHVCDDLHHKTRVERSEYGLIRASGLIRQLILDADPLAHQMNRLYRVGALKFEAIQEDIHRFDSLSVGPPDSRLVMGLHPSHHPSPERARLFKLREFLAIECALVEREVVTVRDIIDYAAHIAGGVHNGVANSALEKHLEKLSKQIQSVMNTDTIGMYMMTIGEVVLDGLHPLRLAARFPPSTP
ncbi:hypothetical protein [Rhodococcoides kyotonense]|uniref:Uncharacterized protein n=1 Tax=Rhodococcoides kyotonense TaxID=398843 RepID=A0A239FNG2_9NOCA|nr:hypothetical protein [Rhodococcus kyotonensis]SNS58381.1 hypothetical protein SAMN05421642_103383 [Rhodococcus kyotonensis]